MPRASPTFALSLPECGPQPFTLNTSATKSTRVTVLCWFGYGVFLQSWPMIVSNAITFLLSSTILGLKLKHG